MNTHSDNKKNDPHGDGSGFFMRLPVTKPYRLAFYLMKKRTSGAYIQGNTEMQSSVYEKQNKNFLAGYGLAAAALLGAFILSIIHPRSNQNNYHFFSAHGGQLYIDFNNAIHPVANVASARLILGKPEDARSVKDSVVDGMKKGAYMGILDAPSDVTQRQDRSGLWGVCDKHDDLSDAIVESVIGGETILDKGVNFLPAGKAILAIDGVLQKEYDTKMRTWLSLPANAKRKTSVPHRPALWVIHDNKRSEVAYEDLATQEAFGITAINAHNNYSVDRNQVLLLKPGLLNTIPATPLVTRPFILGRGEASGLGRDSEGVRIKVGDVLSFQDSTGVTRFDVVFRDGVQRIPVFIAELLLNFGADKHRINQGFLLGVPRVSYITVDDYPTGKPQFVYGSTVCSVWFHRLGDSSSSVHVYLGDRLPVTESEKKQISDNFLFQPLGKLLAADRFVSTGSGGWVAKTVSSGDKVVTTPWYVFISSSGTYHMIAPSGSKMVYDPVFKALGFDTGFIVGIPYNVLELLTRGSDLSITNALVEWAVAPKMVGQRAVTVSNVPKVSGGNSGGGIEGNNGGVGAPGEPGGITIPPEASNEYTTWTWPAGIPKPPGYTPAQRPGG